MKSVLLIALFAAAALAQDETWYALIQIAPNSSYVGCDETFPAPATTGYAGVQIFRNGSSVHPVYTGVLSAGVGVATAQIAYVDSDTMGSYNYACVGGGCSLVQETPGDVAVDECVALVRNGDTAVQAYVRFRGWQTAAQVATILASIEQTVGNGVPIVAGYGSASCDEGSRQTMLVGSGSSNCLLGLSESQAFICSSNNLVALGCSGPSCTTGGVCNLTSATFTGTCADLDPDGVNVFCAGTNPTTTPAPAETTGSSEGGAAAVAASWMVVAVALFAMLNM